ncbi:uncharacterized protein LOC101849338 [Aplysia californica]|uniref:Uncharacterized protein LOC101849338 n=1 Tax=Aplysia californica TaxID=6500 RepID=A0ABM0K9B4_APLCA|nr:uncharacterized protein LOC101849338 [Aplysia californica]
MTGYPDHGICFEANNMYFKSPGVKVSLWTTKDGPDVVFDRYHYKNFTEWCTDMRVVTLEVTVPDYVTDQNAEFRFSFSVKNKTKTDIAKIYNMDSYKECNLHHELQSGEAMLITGQRYPATQDLPQECWLTISTASGDEYEQVCLTLTYLVDQNCVSTLNVSGFQERWWDPVKSIGCHDDLPKESITTGEMCSKDKNLTFLLTRQSSDETGMTFKASIHSKWHTHGHVHVQSQKQDRV